VVSARAPDGVIEGAEDPSHPFLVGVQWHPERRPDDPLTQALFRGLVSAARTVAHAGA
jgi:putative glutamine amidotransferase